MKKFFLLNISIFFFFTIKLPLYLFRYLQNYLKFYSVVMTVSLFLLLAGNKATAAECYVVQSDLDLETYCTDAFRNNSVQNGDPIKFTGQDASNIICASKNYNRYKNCKPFTGVGGHNCDNLFSPLALPNSPEAILRNNCIAYGTTYCNAHETRYDECMNPVDPGTGGGGTGTGGTGGNNICEFDQVECKFNATDPNNQDFCDTLFSYCPNSTTHTGG